MVGYRCYLSPLNIDDAAKYATWLNDYEISQYLTVAPAVLNLQTERESLGILSKEHTYAIVDSATDTLLGNCGLADIDFVNGTAEVGIFIGDKTYQNRGYGTEALRLLLDYAFSVLNLNNLMLKVYSFNDRAIKCYTRIGFKEIGKRRNAVQKNRTQYDIIFMDILPDEFYGTVRTPDNT